MSKMPILPDRRSAIIGGAALLVLPPAPPAAPAPAAGALQKANDRLAMVEERHGGRLGVLALDTGAGAAIAHRPDERLAMCSTFKFLAAAAILKHVDDGKERLDRRIPYAEQDLDSYAPITKARVGEGSMPLADLCAAAVVWSDNTAGNLLLAALGGPEDITSYARSLGDTVTRLDRTEPTLNTAIPGDERDTTSARAMLTDMRAILLGNELTPASRRQLETWLIDAKTGAARIRAGLPSNWRAGDKTGSGANATTNTIGILWPPGGAPILVAVYYTQSNASADARNAVHAEIGRIIVDTFGTN
jgi:beta-lactamase class A